MIDILLLHSVRKKSEDALGQIINKYTAYVCVIIRNTVGEQMAHEDIEEVASDVFYALWENADKCENLKSYLGAIARNKAKNRLRQVVEQLPLMEEILADDGITLEDAIITDDELSMLKSTVMLMDAPDREIFLRHYFASQTVAVIAEEIGMSEAAVKQRLIRGREKLRRTIDKEVLVNE